MQFRRFLPLFAACGRTDAMSGDRVAPGDQQIRETQRIAMRCVFFAKPR